MPARPCRRSRPGPRHATEQLASALRDLGEQAQALADGRPEDAPTLTDYVGRAADGLYGGADRLHAVASDIEQRGVSGVLDDLQTFARRRPGAFLLGAAVVGFGIGRVVKTEKQRRSEEEDSDRYDRYDEGRPVGARPVGTRSGVTRSGATRRQPVLQRGDGAVMSTQSWYQSTSPVNADGYDEERPLGELFSDMTRSVQILVRGEVELAKAEISEQVSKATKAGAMLAGTAVVGFVALLLLAFAAAWGLAEIIPTGVAFLAVGLLFAVVAVVLLSVGKKKLQSVRPVPEQTVQTLREDVEVAKTSFARGAQS